MMRPEDGEGGVPEPPGDAADKPSAADPATITGPVSPDPNPIPAAEHQPNAAARPGEQMAIPGLERADDEVDDAQWRAAAEAEIERRRARDEEIRADWLSAAVGLPSRRNRVGTVFMAASVRGEIRKVGYIHSTASSRHRGMITVWRAA